MEKKEGKTVELQQMKYFKTVAEVGKISTAADSLFISAPALSTSISRLEKELGMPLFDRTNNSITLNRQGHIFLRYVNQIFGSLDCARVELRQSMMQQGQHVSVATMSSNMWVDLITGFSQEYPHFTLSCTSLRLSQFAASGLLPQFAFLLAGEREVPGFYAEELENVPLFEDSLVVMLNPDHPLAKKERIQPADLVGENLLLPVQDYPLYEQLMRSFAAAGDPLMLGNSYSSLVCRHMVTEGIGISFATEHTARTDTYNLCYIPLEVPESRWRVRIFWRKNRTLSPDEQQFLEFVRRLYGA